MSVPLRRNIGLYETLAGLPEGLTGEILDGQIHTQPRPTGLHAHAESVLGMRLGSAMPGWSNIRASSRRHWSRRRSGRRTSCSGRGKCRDDFDRMHGTSFTSWFR
jgi:hypothetical protein